MTKEITMEDVVAFIPGNVQCTFCHGKIKAMLIDNDKNHLWKNPRPCPICKGAGQIHTKNIPTQEEIRDAMINYHRK